MPLKLLDRYVLRRTLATILTAIAVGLLVLLAARFLIVFDVSIGSKNGLSVAVQLLASFVPHYLAFMLPLGLYLASYSVVRSLAVNSELAILQASGISLARIFAPLAVLGIGKGEGAGGVGDSYVLAAAARPTALTRVATAIAMARWRVRRRS